MADQSNLRPPELLLDPMDFLSRSWSVSALEVSEALHLPSSDPDPLISGTHFSFSPAATSQLVLERIMSEALPKTCGRLSNSSGPLTSGGGSLSDSPPVSPSVCDEVKYGRVPTGAKHGSRTVGRWLKDRRERKKEETRAHNADLHAAVSVAGVAAAVAAIAAATAAASGTGKDDRAARTDLAVASAATLVASQCVEAAEALGADREHLAAVVGSAVSVRSPGDIITLTAAAATALRGAATLKARGLKDVWNVAAVTPLDKGQKNVEGVAAAGGELIPAGNYLGLCNQELLARGAELLKRTRKGSLHWKLVSVYINRMGQVTLKMKSSHVAGTFTKKKKSVVVEVCKDVPAWPGRHLLDGGERRRYFGLRMAEQRVIEFECKGQREYEMWTEGVSRLISFAGGRGRLSG